MSSWLAGLRKWCFALALGTLGVLWVIPALAQQPSKLGIAKATSSGQPAPPPKPVEEPSEPAPPGSPRGAVQQYLELSRKGRFQEAGALLDVPASREGERAQLAKRLSAVLNRYVWIDLDKLSEREDGALADGLPPRYEQVGSVPAEHKADVPVRLMRRADGAGWIFSASTIAHIDAWYDGLPDRWLLERLPAPLLRVGPRDLMWWQWLGLLLFVLGSALLGILTGMAVRRVLARAAKHTEATWDDRLIARSRGPLALMLSIAYLRVALPWLLLFEPAEQFVRQGLRGLFLANLVWAFWRLMDVMAELAWDSEWSLAHPSSRALIPLARRVGKAVVSVVAVLLVLSALDYQVSSLIAGLGIGGLAIALASQKTVENLFGAFSLGIDQPFREGDMVRVDGVLGSVERLGLRSTRIRTPDRTVVSIPNGKLADMRLETLAERDRLRLHCNLGLVYGTSAEQVSKVLADLEDVLVKHPKIWPQDISVRFTEFATSSLNVEVTCWFSTKDFLEFTTIRQQVLLAFMKVVEDAGSAFAFPTQTIHLETRPRAARPTLGAPQPAPSAPAAGEVDPS
ncbi:MAG TPA: mechanosensitive ion channel family protein [Polyangiaceae bacterium]